MHYLVLPALETCCPLVIERTWRGMKNSGLYAFLYGLCLCIAAPVSLLCDDIINTEITRLMQTRYPIVTYVNHYYSF